MSDPLRDARAVLADARADRDARRRAMATVRDHLRALPEMATRIATLDAQTPIVLFPVRLETKFRRAPQLQLLVRVYPDSIAGASHEPALTDDEIAAGQAFWQLAWAGDRELDAWRALVVGRRTTRAAWIANQLTPTNLPTRPAGTPAFPVVAKRDAMWTAPVQAHLLPDRWLIRVFANGKTITVESTPIAEPLALSLDPSAKDNELVTLGQGLRVDAESAWTLDFKRALDNGMAVLIPLEPEMTRIEQLVCVGVKTTLDPDATATALADLLDAHHFGRGLALVAQGTPTNNTDASNVGDRELDADASFRVERGAALVSPGSDGAIVAETLGVPDEKLAHVANADRREQRSARAMATALWPCTLGYYLEQMMAPVFDPIDGNAIRAYVTDHVRGRGTCPAIRIGATPYGVLPVTSLARWPQHAEADVVAGSLPDSLRTLRGIWSGAASQVARIGRSSDGESDLLGVLGLDASARSVWVRRALGQDTLWNLFGLLDVAFDDWLRGQRAIADQILEQIAHRDWNPRVLSVTFDEHANRFTGPLVDSHPDEQRPLDPNYIHWLRGASWIPLRRDTLAVKPLLYRMLRHALLLELDTEAFQLLQANRRVAVADRREPELVGIVARTEHRLTAWQRLETAIPEVSGNVPLGEHVLDTGARAAEMRAALAELEGLPSAELERLFTETLDVSSHRLDAWITSLPARRLALLRQQRRASYVGAYGYVEDLSPRAAAAENLGFIQTPSLDHATTAAVLRNAFAARLDASGSCAIDLSSNRVRAALALVDAARQGQPLGAVLGYRLERGLHEGHPTLELDKYIEPLRTLYPLVAKKSGNPDDASEPTEAIAARNVVDGLALRSAWQAGTVPFGSQGLPASGADRDAIEAELRALDDAVDAVGDLLLAETVHQTVRGNAAAAAGTLAALSDGARPPEPEVVMQPRSGIDLLHRAMVVLGDVAPSAGWATTATPRAALEAPADAWIGQLLGDPRSIKLGVGAQQVDLAALDIRPLDVLWLAGNETELAERVHAAAGSDEAIDPRPALADRSRERTLGDALLIARALARIIAGGRPLRPSDFARPEAKLAADPLAQQAYDRAHAARDRLRMAAQTLGAATGNARIAALREIADHGFTGVFPAPGASLDERVTRALAEAKSRLDAAEAATTSDEIVAAVLGRDVVFLPRITVASGAALDTALGSTTAIGATPAAVRTWLHGAARVREPLARWRQLALITGAFGRDDIRFEIAQLPHGGRWIALPFETRPPSGIISLAMLRPTNTSLASAVSGIAIDEWTEIVPDAKQTTGIAIHHDAPNAEAPQALFVAVTPPTVSWSADLLVETVRETIDLAKIRAVDTDLLGSLGQLLPTVFLPDNSAGDALGVRFTAELEAAPARIAES